MCQYIIKIEKENREHAAIHAKSREMVCFQGAANAISNTPSYLERIPAQMEVRLMRLPLLSEMPIICEIQRVIEFYLR